MPPPSAHSMQHLRAVYLLIPSSLVSIAHRCVCVSGRALVLPKSAAERCTFVKSNFWDFQSALVGAPSPEGRSSPRAPIGESL